MERASGLPLTLRESLAIGPLARGPVEGRCGCTEHCRCLAGPGRRKSPGSFRISRKLGPVK